MKRFETNTFKSFTFILILLASLSFGCEKEILTETDAPIALFDGVNGIQRPGAQCGTSVFAPMLAGVTNLGSAEILNSSDELYVILDMNAFKFIDQIKVFVGDKNALPLDPDGNVLLEAFPYQYLLPLSSNEYTFTLPTASIPACNDIVVWARVKTRNMMGQVTATNDAWMSGTPVSNGFSTNYCITSCVSGNTGNASAL